MHVYNAPPATKKMGAMYIFLLSKGMNYIAQVCNAPTKREKKWMQVENKKHMLTNDVGCLLDSVKALCSIIICQ